jgi:hypothetical protein
MNKFLSFNHIGVCLFKAAISFAEENVNYTISKDICLSDIENDYKKHPCKLIRAFLAGAVYQRLFGQKHVTRSTMIACIAYANTLFLDEGNYMIGSVQSVIEAMAMDKNHPNAKDQFTILVRAYMAGVEWSIQHPEKHMKSYKLF